ncbi:MAG: ATP-binding protein [Planctomycetota bacterium]|nr:ATP-binding protein [Planctomycetota bacterium]
MAKHDFAKLTLPNDLSYIPMAQVFAREAARQFGFAAKEQGQIEVAVEEAVTNVIKHAYEANEERPFDIICERIPLGLTIRIKEQGLPFDPSQLTSYSPAATLDDQAIGGLGVFLMKGLMNEVSFHNLGPEGKETRLVKYLPNEKVQQALEADKAAHLAAPPAPEPAPIAEKVEYGVRRMEPHEAIEVSRCAYKSHGYTFFDEHIYYPERLVKLNESGELVSAVAVTSKNVFMGHAGVLYPHPGSRIAELTFVFVNVEYRGQGCMNRLVDFLFTTPKLFPLSGLYAYAVTNHPITQKSMAKFGINDCGMLLATSPATWMFKGMPEYSQRISVALEYRYLEPPKPLTLYPPPQHRAMIEKLYKNINAPCHTYQTPPAAPLPSQSSAIQTAVFASEGCAEIHVTSYGADVVRAVKAMLRDLCLKQVAAIDLFLRLEDPATSYMTAEFEKLGFFFAGILPRGEIGESLILQYLNNVPFDYGKVVVYADVAKELLAYIRAHDPQAAL